MDVSYPPGSFQPQFTSFTDQNLSNCKGSLSRNLPSSEEKSDVIFFSKSLVAESKTLTESEEILIKRHSSATCKKIYNIK